MKKFKGSRMTFLNFKKSFIIYFGCAGSYLLHGLVSSCGEQELPSSCCVQASHCGGFSCCGVWALECAGFSSCSSRAP